MMMTLLLFVITRNGDKKRKNGELETGEMGIASMGSQYNGGVGTLKKQEEKRSQKRLSFWIW